jgi:hypothetical protein
MIGNRPPRRSGSGSKGPDRPFRDDREQKAQARQAAEALFAPKPPPPSVDEPPAGQPGRQPRILKPAPPAAHEPTHAAATSEAVAAISPPHVARIRAWMKYGMTIAQIADTYRVPITEIKRLLGKP